MRIEVQCFATLASHTPQGGSMDVVEGTTIEKLIEMLNIDKNEVRLVFVNGKNQADWSFRIHPGDRIGIFPPVGGG
ncbi:thiamine biosynthesis protein ThiS [Desulfoplanes formicivorans]|uniref:Thiamine biosynthesis protein ThiS n=2 Tax=Desulfoplanes formicivorans TaxID=1592317 RepID=A0A194AD27_9BACT|nr:thiamine biosynthesis protein ThiS [Desulfoplanes formicivorans]